MLEISVGKYTFYCHTPGLPDLYEEYVERATLAEQIGLSSAEGTSAFLAIGNPDEWPFLVVAQRCIPGENSGFHPGAIIVPETDILFIGGGKRLLAYDLKVLKRLWEDEASICFRSWNRSGDVILMSAEDELAAWDIHASKLWSTFADPPWSYSVIDDTLMFEMAHETSFFPIRKGPQK